MVVNSQYLAAALQNNRNVYTAPATAVEAAALVAGDYIHDEVDADALYLPLGNLRIVGTTATEILRGFACPSRHHSMDLDTIIINYITDCSVTTTSATWSVMQTYTVLANGTLLGSNPVDITEPAAITITGTGSEQVLTQSTIDLTAIATCRVPPGGLIYLEGLMTLNALASNKVFRAMVFGKFTKQ